MQGRQSGFQTGGVVGPGLKTGGVVVLNIEQTEANSTGLRVLSPELFMEL